MILDDVRRWFMLVTQSAAFVTGKEKTPDDEPTLMQLIYLKEHGEKNEFGEINKPTAYAYDTAYPLVVQAYRALGDKFPTGCVSLDDAGGIRIRWKGIVNKREVRLFCSSEPGSISYIYYEKPDKFDIIKDFTAKALIEQLIWLDK